MEAGVAGETFSGFIAAFVFESRGVVPREDTLELKGIISALLGVLTRWFVAPVDLVTSPKAI